MKLRISFVLVVFAFLFTNLCYAQIAADYNFLGGGARARAMGGAFFAVSDDPSAGSWNPAGLAQLDLPQTNLTFYSGRMKVGHNLGDISKEFKMSDDLILSGGVAIPFKVSSYQMVGSASYERVSVFSNQSYYKDIDRSEEISGNVDAVTLSLGREFLKGFSLGMAVNVYSGGYTFKAFQLDQLISISGSDTTLNDTSMFYHPLVKGDYSGFSLQFGTMFKDEYLSFGAVVKTPFTLKEKIDAQMEHDVIVGSMVNPNTNHPGGVLYFSENKWKLPLIFGFGSAFRVENLTIAVDVEYRDFSKAELTYKDAYIPNMNSPTKTINLEWEEGAQFRVGGEYIISTKFGKIPLRAGYRNDPKVFTSIEDVVVEVDTIISGELGNLKQTDTGTKKTQVEGNVLSCGTGIAWSQIRFDITYEYSKYDYTLSGTAIDELRAVVDEEGHVIKKGVNAPFEDKITNKDSRVMIGFTGYF
jgi:long-subunit fatty acid transport protein